VQRNRGIPGEDREIIPVGSDRKPVRRRRPVQAVGCRRRSGHVSEVRGEQCRMGIRVIFFPWDLSIEGSEL
jgi:hypothetical protein